MVNAVLNLLKPLKRRLSHMIARGVISLIDDSTSAQSLQVRLLADEVLAGIERFQQYGLTSHPHPGAEVITLFPGGNRSHGITVAVDDRRYRLRSLQPGEVALYDDQGSVIHLQRDNNIRIASTNSVVIDSPDVQVNGDVNVAGDVVANGISLVNHTHQYTRPADPAGPANTSVAQ